jgi:hypothetical protein
MTGGITNEIKFQMMENTIKFYWKGKRTDIDYPSSHIGTRTPSRFIWSKMAHLFNMSEQEVLKPDDKIVVDASGNEYSACEFFAEISDTTMWTFDLPLKLLPVIEPESSDVEPEVDTICLPEK